MCANNFYHQVGQRVGQKKNVEDFQDFVDIVSSCRQSLVMNATIFWTFQKEFLNPITLVKSLNLNKYR